MEDIFVDREFRGKGYGKALFLHLAGLAVQRKCRRMEWVALDWNEPAIAFYESLGAVRMNEWHIFRLDEDRIRRLVEK